MDLHEFQAKEILAKYGVTVPSGGAASTAQEAVGQAEKIGGNAFVVKAQVLAGGRGKAGGVKIVDSLDSVKSWTEKFLGRTLVTEQTGPHGQTVKQVYIEKAIQSYRPIFCAVITDQQSGMVTLLGAGKGGEDIELRAASAPSIIEKLPIDHSASISSHDFVGFAERLGLEPPVREQAAKLFENLVKAFCELDATLIEINPLAVTEDDNLIALDAKISIDNNALFRHEDFREIRETSDRDPAELQAQAHQINFVRLEGDIGMVVNGAGLALATNDMLIDAGGRPANFMDIRTSATSTQIARGIDLVFNDPSVKVVLVNIYGGGLARCDTVADAIGISRRRTGSTTPIVFRAAGTNADFAHKALKNYGVPYVDCKTMTEAVNEAISLVKKAAA